MESVNYYSLEEQDTFRTIFEVDMINFPVESLAKSHYSGPLCPEQRRRGKDVH